MTVSSSVAGNVITSANVTDDDVQAIVSSSAALTIDENQSNGAFNVSLAFRPAAAVVVTLTSDDPDIATVSPVTMTFEPGSYNVVQTATVSGTDDPNLVVDSTTIVLASTGVASTNVNIDVNDDETQAIQLMLDEFKI